MASRKDKKGRVLRKGEIYREDKQMYEYRYTDPSGKRRSVYSKDLAKLRGKIDALRRDQMDGIDSYVAGNADLNFMFDRYMSTKTELRASTRANYQSSYDRYVRDDFGKTKLKDIKYSDILFFYKRLISEKNLQMGSIMYLQRVIRPSLEMAVRDNIIRTNPAAGVMAQLKSKNNTTSYVRHALTVEQERAFLSFLDEYPLYEKWKNLFTVFLGTGCRVGEVIALRWDDVDFEQKVISINHSLYYFAGKRNKSPSKWVMQRPKTDAGIRTIPMVDVVYNALQDEKARQLEEKTWCKTSIDGVSGFVFCNRFREVFTPESINRELTRIIETYNSIEEVDAIKQNREPVMLPHFTCHHLRHTFCTRLCEADANIKVIQAVMGHKDIQTTLDIYAEVSEQKKKSSMDEIFNQIFIV